MNGGVAETTLSQGFHLVKPTQKVTTYTIGIEQSYLTSGSDGDSKGDESFEVPSNDGKGLTVDMTFTYRFDPDQVADTFTRFKGQSGKDVKEIFIKPNIMSWTKEVTAKYSVIDLLGDQRASLNSELTAYLKDKFEPYGIIIESVSLINMNPLPKVSPSPSITTPSMNGSASVSPPAKLWVNPSPASSPTKTPNRMLRDGHST